MKNKIKPNHDIGSVIERLDKFDFEMSRIADTQGEVTMLRSSVPPPNFQPTTRIVRLRSIFHHIRLIIQV